jgi:hypothetical protein
MLAPGYNYFEKFFKPPEIKVVKNYNSLLILDYVLTWSWAIQIKILFRPTFTVNPFKSSQKMCPCLCGFKI